MIRKIGDWRIFTEAYDASYSDLEDLSSHIVKKYELTGRDASDVWNLLTSDLSDNIDAKASSISDITGASKDEILKHFDFYNFKLTKHVRESAEAHIDKINAFLKVAKEHPELSVLPISMSPDGKPITKIYRTVRQTDLFDDIYGTHGTNTCMPIVYADKGKITPLPKTKPMTLLNAETSDNPEWSHTTDWTIDPGYYYQVHDEVIRICLDFEKVKRLVGNDNILNLLHDGEAEIRLRDPLPLLQVLDHIEIVKENFEEDVEGEWGEDRAIKTWFPKELMPFLKLHDGLFPFQTPKYCKDMMAYYDEIYAEYGVEPIKPYGNTWIDQKQ